MDVLKIVGIALVIVVVGAVVYFYDEYIKNRFNNTIFQMSRVIFFVIAEREHAPGKKIAIIFSDACHLITSKSLAYHRAKKKLSDFMCF